MQVEDLERLNIDHGMALLREAASDTPWSGKVAVVPIDDICRWDRGDGSGVCGERIMFAHAFQGSDGGQPVCWVLAVCSLHSLALQSALIELRNVN
jgi:hypothetical protein